MRKTYTFLLASMLVCFAVFGFLLIKPIKIQAADCAPNATKQCISNIVYWYDSCGALQSIYQNCNTTNQICQNGQCVNDPNAIVSHYSKRCYNNNLYWYNSKGAVGDLAQSCSDSNSCTIDSCASNACANKLTCDGSSCAVNSQDYAKYCVNAKTETLGAQGQGLVVSMFEEREGDTLAWQKSIDAKNNDNINFLLIIKNSSDLPMNSVLVKADIPTDILYTDSIKIDNQTSTQNITSGIDLGTIGPKTSKIISFTGKVLSQSNHTQAKITVNISASNATYDFDYVTVNIENQATAAVATPSPLPTKTTASNSLMNSLRKNWWIMLIIAIILVVVFIIIFRRLSSNV